MGMLHGDKKWKREGKDARKQEETTAVEKREREYGVNHNEMRLRMLHVNQVEENIEISKQLDMMAHRDGDGWINA